METFVQLCSVVGFLVLVAVCLGLVGYVWQLLRLTNHVKKFCLLGNLLGRRWIIMDIGYGISSIVSFFYFLGASDCCILATGCVMISIMYHILAAHEKMNRQGYYYYEMQRYGLLGTFGFCIGCVPLLMVMTQNFTSALAFVSIIATELILHKSSSWIEHNLTRVGLLWMCALFVIFFHPSWALNMNPFSVYFQDSPFMQIDGSQAQARNLFWLDVERRHISLNQGYWKALCFHNLLLWLRVGGLAIGLVVQMYGKDRDVVPQDAVPPLYTDVK